MCVYTIYRSFCFVYVVVFLIVSFSLSLYCKVQQKLFCFFGVVKSSGLLYMIRVFQAMVGIAAGWSEKTIENYTIDDLWTPQEIGLAQTTGPSNSHCPTTWDQFWPCLFCWLPNDSFAIRTPWLVNLDGDPTLRIIQKNLCGCYHLMWVNHGNPK